jgi:hypothetical protein
MLQSKTQKQYYELHLPNREPFSSYDTGNGLNFEQLSLVNLFIGSNNSGKSRFLRELFIEKECKYITKTFNAKVYLDYVKKIRPEFIKIFQDDIIQIGSTSKTTLDKFRNNSSYYLSPQDNLYDEIFSSLEETLIQSGAFRSKSVYAPKHQQCIVENMKNFGAKAIEALKKLKEDGEVKSKMSYYIPIIRGMRPLDNTQGNLYQKRTMSDYFQRNSNTQENTYVSRLTEGHSVFTGLELYNTLKDKLLGEPEDRDAVRRYEEFLSYNFFDSKSITLIPREGDNTVHVKIGNEKQLSLFNLGDGLQNLIIITFNMFMESERCLFFIEEPDLCMHPGLQRAFIDTISNLNHHQYFITTHSNHFLDMTLDFSDISVYLFRKNVEEADPKFCIRLVSSRDQNLLQDLGVRNSSVFLTNATIWVEGITDRLYLKAYMRKYIDENFKEQSDREDNSITKLKEDYHYTFVEYQGSNLKHWSFNPDDEEDERIKASFMCGHPILIADGDIKNKGDRLSSYEEMLGEKLVVLDCKEIENLLPLEVLKELVKTKFQKYGKDVNSLDYGKYSKSKKGLGNYLDKLLKLEKDGSVFSAESGTIQYKIKFCNNAINIMSNPDFNWSLNGELTKLCKRIFDHIMEYNKSTSQR